MLSSLESVDFSDEISEPTLETIEPTVEPTLEPTVEPTQQLTTEPTVEPTEEPTIEPSTSEEIKSYTKDEDGFYILEEDYFVNDSYDDGLKQSKVRFSNTLDESYVYPQMKLFVKDKQIPLFNCKTNFSQLWNGDAPQRMNNSVATIEMEGKVELKLQCNFAILEQCVIRPLSANIIPEIDENRRVISFEVTSPGQYSIELRSKRTLHLFVNSYQEFEHYKQESNLMYFGPGIHNKDNNNLIPDNSIISLNSNTTVYIDNGAIVQAGFFASNKSNIKIVGGGIVDGSVFDRSATKNTRLIPYEFNYCNNISFDGIITTDPAGWCYNMYFCNQVNLNNIKIISSRSNGDGVSIQSCQNVVCKNSFVRSWDDSLVVKNYPRWYDRSQHGTTKNILFENCILWTDLAQSMEVGFETVGKIMEDITFKDITVLHNYHKAPISIHNGNNADINNVKFINITIEDAAMGQGDGNKYLVDFSTEFSATWSSQHTTTSLGSISDILIENVLVLNAIDDAMFSFKGCIDTREGYNNSTHYINDVTLKDIYLVDKIIDENSENIYKNEYTNNIVFEKSGNEISGHIIDYIDSSEYGNNLLIETL